jgi:ParB-like chromosome segregation protein Spo0J
MSDDGLEQLAASLRELGQLMPLIVTPEGNWEVLGGPDQVDAGLGIYIKSGGRFEIVDGHRRYTAGGRAGVELFDCLVFFDIEQAKFAMMLHANIVREDVTAAEEGWQFVELSEKHGWNLEQMVRFFRVSEHYINERVDIVRKDPRVAAAVHARQLNLAQAKQILRAKTELLRGYLLDQAIVHGANARTLQVMIQNHAADLAEAEGNMRPHTPENSPAATAPPADVCVWCREGADPENLKQVWVHWYHLRELLAVVDKVGSHNVLRTAAEVPVLAPQMANTPELPPVRSE